MTTIVQKWSNSLGLRLPKEIAKKLKLTKGSRVAIKTGRNQIIIETALNYKDLPLEEMVERITPKNRHDFMDWGPAVGKEVW